MKCFHCQQEIKRNRILINQDGDFVCDEKCKKNYEKERDYFFNSIVHSEKETKNWLLGI